VTSSLELIERLESREARVKYGASKALRILSEREPAVLSPHFDFFAGQLGCDNTLLKWNAILILGNLAAVDAEGRFERIFRAFFKPIAGPVMITAANTIRAAGSIACARPELAGRIARELLKVDRATYQTPECRQIAIGHAIEALDRFFPSIERPKPVVEFVERHRKSSRGGTAKKAERFLRRHGRRPAKKKR
jgi:hypothetical protein